jgi:hypothetical protein
MAFAPNTSCYTTTEFPFSWAYDDTGFASAHVFRIAIRSQAEAKAALISDN